MNSIDFCLRMLQKSVEVGDADTLVNYCFIDTIQFGCEHCNGEIGQVVGDRKFVGCRSGGCNNSRGGA